MTATIRELFPEERKAHVAPTSTVASDVELLAQIENWANSRRQITTATEKPLAPGIRQKAERILEFIKT